MAKRNLDEVFKDYRGNVMRMLNPLVSPAKEEDITLGLVCTVACWTMSGDGSDNSMDLKKKMELYQMGERCSKGGIVDFKTADITLIQERIGKIFVHIQTIGLAHEMLEKDWVAPIIEVAWPEPTIQAEVIHG